MNMKGYLLKHRRTFKGRTPTIVIKCIRNKQNVIENKLEGLLRSNMKF